MKFLPKTPEQKRTFIYIVIALLLIAVIGCTGYFSDSFSEGYGFAMLCFLALGMIHVWTFYEFLPFKTGSFSKEAGFTFVLALVGAAFVVAIYHFKSHDWQLGLGFASCLVAFIFPMMAMQTYQFFRQIPPADYKKWYYPTNKDLPDLDLLDLSRVLVLQFEFTKKADETAFTNFRAKAPVAMLFGDLFFIFINDYNDRNPNSPIEYLDANNQPYGWVFYKRGSLLKGNQYMDFNSTFQANGIVDNETIVAVRG
jgi:hypothetical protein